MPDRGSSYKFANILVSAQKQGERKKKREDPQDPMRTPINRQIQIRIVKNNIRTLPPKLQRHILQITLRRILTFLLNFEVILGEGKTQTGRFIEDCAAIT